MKIVLEGREYELKANGAFVLNYKKFFNGNAITELYNASQNRDLLAVAKLTYCAISPQLEESFEDWLNSFETPLFLASASQDILAYLFRDGTPTVENNDLKKTEKK